MTEVDTDQISDGYHTFGELYAHRSALFIALMATHPKLSWYSLGHDDGTPMYSGMFIAGMDLPTGQVTYHLMMDPWWGMLQQLPIAQLSVARPWDGHLPTEALRRLTEWISQRCGQTP